MAEIDRCTLSEGSRVEDFRVISIENWGQALRPGSGPSGMCEVKWIMSLAKNKTRNEVYVNRGGCKVCHRGVVAILKKSA